MYISKSKQVTSTKYVAFELGNANINIERFKIGTYDISRAIETYSFLFGQNTNYSIVWLHFKGMNFYSAYYL